ncbi:hypothetical protein L7F22_017756, partial [Adiantum nelumboides]|nr:hypothetical protein [Adiantum nelumboides]
VKVQNGDCYLLEPMAFAWESLKVSSDGETMIKAGWIEIREDTPSENLRDMFTESFKNVIQYLASLKALKSRKQNNEGTSQVNQNKTLKESEALSVGTSTGNVEQESLSLVPLEAPHRDEASLTRTPLITPSIAVFADSTSVKVLSSIVQPEEEYLDKKTFKSGLDDLLDVKSLVHFFKQDRCFEHVDQSCASLCATHKSPSADEVESHAHDEVLSFDDVNLHEESCASSIVKEDSFAYICSKESNVMACLDPCLDNCRDEGLSSSMC